MVRKEIGLKHLNEGRKGLAFEQLPRESAKSYAAFKTYLEMGSQRSLVATAAKRGTNKSLIERWSRQHQWVDRVAAYTAHLGEVERKAIERVAVEKAVEWEKVHEPTKRLAWLEAEKTIAMVRKARELWEEKGRPPGWEGMARMLELAFKLKQFAAGMPSDVKQVNTTVQGKIDVDWEIAIRKAYGVEAPPATKEDAPVVDVEAEPRPGSGEPVETAKGGVSHE